MADDLSKARRLRKALTQPVSLSLDEARIRLPDLVMAELAGDDVDTTFADLLAALDRYPTLAEAYAALSAAMYEDLATEPVVSQQADRTLQTQARRLVAGSVIRRWGEHNQHFLVQLQPYRDQSSSSYIREATTGYTVEPLQGPEPVTIVAELQAQSAQHWELLVTVLSETTIWRISAMTGDVELPVIERHQHLTRFGPLSQVPVEPIILSCVAESA